MCDAKQWKRILVSQKFKNEGNDLREAIAKFAQKLATKIMDPSSLEPYVAGRLIALEAPGEAELQEVLRRIVGKTISWCLSQEIQEAEGPLYKSRLD